MKRQPTISEALVDLRTRLGLSCQVLATNLGMSMQALHNYEKNRRIPRKLSPQLLIKLTLVSWKANYADLAEYFRRQFFDALDWESLSAEAKAYLGFALDSAGLLFSDPKPERHKAEVQ